MISYVAAPFTDTKNVQMNVRVLVVMFAVQPRVGTNKLNTQFFIQLTNQCCMGDFAGLNFSAREFPIARVHRVRRTLAEQEFPVGALDNGGGDMNGFWCFQGLGLRQRRIAGTN